jgi:hypothetical protein
MSLFLFVFVCALVCIACSARILNFEDLGGKAFDVTYETAVANGNLFNATLNAIQPGDVFVIPRKIFTMVGGIKARGIKDFILQIDGTIVFTNDRDTWPKNSNGDVEECIYLEDIANVVFTSTGKGLIDGNCKEWWGAI